MRKAVLKSDAPPLSEQDIRRLAIGFLRVYYRYRPRRDFMGTETHDKPHVFRNKITIDARLTFFEEDGAEFIATVEATDLKRRHELDYRFNWAAIFQDALAAGMVFGVLSLALPQVWGGNYGLDLLTGQGWWQLLRNTLLGMALYVGFTYRRVAYRYIYAVNQFRRFYANDQWVAFDAALYPEPLDPRLLELERQCVRFGFGMMIVEPDRSVRLLVAPSKIDQFSGSRKQLPPWVERMTSNPMMDKLRGSRKSDSAGQASQSIRMDGSANLDPLSENYVTPSRPSRKVAARPSGIGRLRQRWRRWWIHRKYQWRRLGRSMVIDPEAPLFYRFRPLAWTVVVLAMGTFVGVYFLERYDQEIVTLGEPRSIPNINNLEHDDIDRAMPPDQAEIDRLREIAAGRTMEEDGFNDRNNPLSSLEDEPEVLGGTDIYSYRLEEGFDAVIRHECSRLYELLEEPHYLVVAGGFEQFITAQLRADRLHQQTRLPVTVTRSSCLQSDGFSNFSLYLSDLLETEAEANYLLRSWRREYGLDLEILEID